MIADAHVDILLELAHREHRLGETDVFARTWLPLLEAGERRAPGLPRLRRPRAPARGLAAGGAAAGDGAPARAPREPRPPRRRALARRPRRGRARRADRADARARGRRAVRLRGRDRRSLLGARAADGRTDLEPAQPVRRRRRGRGRALAARPNAAGALRRARRRSSTSRTRRPRVFDECIASYEGRICVTHAGCRAVNETPRNLSDEQLRALADRDGVFGLMLHPLTIDPVEPTIAPCRSTTSTTRPR